MIPAPQSPQALVPPRIAGRCGPRGGRLRPPRFILHHFRPGVSPRRSKVRFVQNGLRPFLTPLSCSSSPNRNRCAGLRLGMRGNPATKALCRALGRWRGTGPPRPGKGHTGPHERQRGGAVALPFSLFLLCINSFLIPLVSSYRSVTGGGVSPHSRGSQGEQFIGVVALAAVPEVVRYPDQPRVLQLPDGPSHGAV